jgi:hypothetical protein
MLQDGFDVGAERRPVKEVVVAGDRKLGIVERERGVADLGVGNELRTPFDLLVEEVWVLAVKQIDSRGIGSAASRLSACRSYAESGEPKGTGCKSIWYDVPSRKGTFWRGAESTLRCLCPLGGHFYDVGGCTSRECALVERFRDAGNDGRILG